MHIIGLFIYAHLYFRKEFKTKESGKTWKEFGNLWKLELDVILEITKSSRLYFTEIKWLVQSAVADWKRLELLNFLYSYFKYSLPQITPLI